MPSEGFHNERYLRAIGQVGVARFQYLLLGICGVVETADAVEILAVSFVVPAVETRFSLTGKQEGWLTAMIFVGMMLGSWVWGTLADRHGRRLCLSLAMAVNGIGGVLSAASQNYGTLLFFRFLSGFGVGGSLPIVFVYFSEFFPVKRRQSFLIYLATFWVVGGLYAAGTAWALIPKETVTILFETASWRWYLVVAGFPSLLAAVLLWFAAIESPAFHMAQGRIDEAAEGLATMAAVNRAVLPPNVSAKAHFRALLSDDGAASGAEAVEQDDLSDDDRRGLLGSGGAKAPTSDAASAVGPSSSSSSLPSASSASAGSGSGWSGRLRAGCSDIGSQTAQLFRGAHARAAYILLLVWFTLSFGFYSFTLWLPKYFHDFHPQPSVYTSAFLDALSNIPGCAASLIVVHYYGPSKSLAASMLLSSLAVVLFAAAKTVTDLVVMSCVFAAVSVGGWNALNILSTLLFPFHIRSSAYGVFAAAGRIGSITGNVIFGYFVDSYAAVPLFIVSACLLTGGASVLFLPRTEEETVGHHPHDNGHAASPSLSPNRRAPIDE